MCEQNCHGELAELNTFNTMWGMLMNFFESLVQQIGFCALFWKIKPEVVLSRTLICAEYYENYCGEVKEDFRDLFYFPIKNCIRNDFKVLRSPEIKTEIR